MRGKTRLANKIAIGNPSNDSLEGWGVKRELRFIILNWSFLFISSLIASIFLKLNRQLKPGCLVCCLWNPVPRLSGTWCDAVIDSLGHFSSFIKWVSKQPLFMAISLSRTVITDCTDFLKQRVAIIQFTVVPWKNLVLFPPEQPHFIIALCVSIRSIFSIYSLHICPRRAVCVCVRPFSVGLTLSRIHATTHRGPCLHPPSSPWKVHLPVSASISAWSLQPNLPPTSNLRVSGGERASPSASVGFSRAVLD